ncbi:SKP1-like protein 14 [Cornus florida]|uniref:SKP1-like protein 14 n=1 Tax=Cornus florida TaxID=4283 RepID=UPI00289DD101|nr:SKP1-like protein 14 [Cornus florida]
MSEPSENMLTLTTFDKDEFSVEQSLAIQSELIKNMIEDECELTTIPLPNVTTKVLEMIIEFWRKHADSKAPEEDLKKFDAEFIEKPIPELFQLVQAADYLNTHDLWDLTCQKIADNIKDMMPEEVREIFNIENDLTPEEEEEIRREYAWAFEV